MNWTQWYMTIVSGLLLLVIKAGFELWKESGSDRVRLIAVEKESADGKVRLLAVEKEAAIDRVRLLTAEKSVESEARRNDSQDTRMGVQDTTLARIDENVKMIRVTLERLENHRP